MRFWRILTDHNLFGQARDDKVQASVHSYMTT